MLQREREDTQMATAGSRVLPWAAPLAVLRRILILVIAILALTLGVTGPVAWSYLYFI